MTQTQQPEALRLARKFEEVGFMGDHRFAKDYWCRQAAAELRHQHARIAELEAQLSAIGAGGVEPLRKQAEDGWIQDGPLLYRLTDERRPKNRDEIIVTMANSSRTEEARTRRAGELLDAIRAAAPQAVHPENIREGAPYDNPEFEQLARDMGVWGTAQSAVCAQFWLAATQPAAQGMDAQTLKHISALSELVRMPNAEHFADAHNAAVRHLRVIAAQAKQGG